MHTTWFKDSEGNYLNGDMILQITVNEIVKRDGNTGYRLCARVNLDGKDKFFWLEGGPYDSEEEAESTLLGVICLGGVGA